MEAVTNSTASNTCRAARLIAGAGHHDFRENASAMQVLGIGGIKTILGRDHQKSVIGGAFCQNFGRQRDTGGKLGRQIRKPRNMKSRIWKQRRIRKQRGLVVLS